MLRAGELDDRAAIEACAQICDGLAHAHAAGILHRDVKPSNVLLADGDRVSVRLLDFGLARMAEAETLTAQGDVPGTLAYIAPERLAGDDATGAADVWAVGVMLWESLAGRHPFWQTSMLETARAIEAGAPSLAALRPDLPKALLQLVDRALSLAPARRPSAQELAAHLRGAAAPRRKKRSRSGGFALAVPPQAGRVGAAALAAGFAGWTAAALPFFPHGWVLGLAGAVAALTAVRERLGLAVALAVPVLPLGNVSLGLAVVYAALAAAWLALSWREPRGGLLFALGPMLAPLAALGLVPLAASGLRSRPDARRRPRSPCSPRRSSPGSGTSRSRSPAARPRSASASPAPATRSTSRARSPAPPRRIRRSSSRPLRSPCSPPCSPSHVPAAAGAPRESAPRCSCSPSPRFPPRRSRRSSRPPG